jgi:hypothetical protein
MAKHPDYDDRAGHLFKGLYDQIVLSRLYCAEDGITPVDAERMAVEMLIETLVMIASSTSIAPDELVRMVRREVKANSSTAEIAA